jgi:hypothetical protein
MCIHDSNFDVKYTRISENSYTLKYINYSKSAITLNMIYNFFQFNADCIIICLHNSVREKMHILTEHRETLIKFVIISIWIIFLHNFIYFRQHKFCIDKLYINNLLHVPAIQPSSGMYIHCWLHCSPLILANAYNGYILCCWIDILWCNAKICIIIKMLNIKIVKF